MLTYARYFAPYIIFICAITFFLLSYHLAFALIKGNQSACCTSNSRDVNTVIAAQQSGATIQSVTVFSSGNTNTNLCSSSDCSTSFYKNSDGTYNTVTVNNTSSNNNSGGGGGGGYGQSLYNGYGQGSYDYDGGCGSGKGQSPCPAYGQGAYYGQSGYYTQGAYYGQNTYYSQLTYYFQSAYITGMSINANPQLVRQEEGSTITWNGGNTTSCTVTGPGLNSNLVVGSEVVSNIVNESIYTLTCTLGPRTETATTSVKVLPKYQET